MTTAPSQAASPGLFEKIERRVVLATIGIAVLCVPFVVFAILSGQASASSWAAWAGFTAVINLAIGGRLVGWLSIGLLTALVPVAIVAGAVPLAGAGLMAILCLGVGLSAARGLNRGMLLIPLFLAFMMIAPPPWDEAAGDRNSTPYLVWNMVIWGGGGLWALLVFPALLRKMKPAHAEPNSRADTTIYTVIITMLCTAATLAVLAWQLGSYGAWLVVTLLVVTEVGHEDTVKRTVARVGGTLIGAGAAAVLAALTSSEAVLIGLGLVSMVIALVIRFGPHYWLYMAFMTPTIILFSSTSAAGVPIIDAARAGYTLIGGALVLIASAIPVLWARYRKTPGAGALPAASR